MVVFGRSQSVALVHTHRKDVEIPSWVEGLGELLDLFGEQSYHLITSSRELETEM